MLANAEDVADYVVRLRRELHLQPELMWTEHKTSAVVKRELTAMGVSFEEISAPGVVATIGSGSAPVVALRADMDALPVTEESDIPAERRSQIPGKMHACGHDGHTAMLLGAAKVLKSVEPELRGTVRLVFQPAEEGGAGARRMLEDGLRRARRRRSSRPSRSTTGRTPRPRVGPWGFATAPSWPAAARSRSRSRERAGTRLCPTKTSTSWCAAPPR